MTKPIEQKRAADTLSQVNELMQTGLVDKRCPVHGNQLFRVPSGNLICEKCAGEAEQMQERISLAEEQKSALLEKKAKALAELNFPGRLKEHTFDNYNPADDRQKSIKGSVEEYSERFHLAGGLLLIGSIGTGKTHLAAALCQDLACRGYFCHLTGVNRIVRAVRSSWHNSDITEQEIIDKYVDYDLLVIDEIGSQYGTNSERIIINEIINDRYEWERPTVIIGNVNLTEAKEILGERVIDRLLEGGNILVFNWKSHRRVETRR